MRDWVYQSLSNFLPLKNAVGDRIYSSGSAGQRQANEPKPFLIFRAGVERGFSSESTVTRQPFYVYVHVETGSTVELDTMMSNVRAALRLPQPVQIEGRLVMDCVWDEDSEDLYDDVFDSTTRFGTYTITARK